MNGFPSQPPQHMNQMVSDPFFGPPHHMQQHIPLPNKTGGLLSRLLQTGNASSGGINLGGMLGNIQQGLKVAETVTPMIQQYGPLIKNIPAMISMYKEIMSSNSTDSSKNESSKNPKKTKKKAKQGQTKKSAHSSKQKSKKQQPPSKKIISNKKSKSPTKIRSSAPKLYI
jgi:hypothetical protein